MDIAAFSLAALATLAPGDTGPSVVMGGTISNQVGMSTPSARRSTGGASATATISARIISNSARIAAGAPPRPAMAPRAATIAAADGSPVAALIYDFE